MRQFIEGRQGPNGEMQVHKVNTPMLLIIAEKLSRRFIMTMNQNINVMKWVWFRPTTASLNMKEIYKDIQSMIGGDIVNEEEGVFLSKFTLDQFGLAETATATRHELILTISEEQAGSNAYLDRQIAVKKQIENAEDQIEKKQIQDRYANLTGGVAAIKVMAATEQDTNELKLRIEDAINATRAAMEEGYVAGGGVALFNAVEANETDGEKVLKEASKALITQILHNAGYEDIDKILTKLKKGYGINVLTDEIVDMKKEGVIDPVKVVRLILLHAVSVAGLLLTSEYVVTEENDEIDTVKKFFTQK
jgi:chaperonin GroEL